MRILILNYRDAKHPQAGGAEVHLHRIFGRIASWGHPTMLLTTSFPGALERETVDGIEVVRFGSDLLFQVQVALRLRKVIRDFKPDVLVEDLNKLPFYTTLFTKVPKFIQIHHLWRSSIFHEASFPVAFMVWVQEQLIPWFYKGSAFAAVSPSTVGELQGMGIPGKDISLIYNGCEEDWASLEPVREKSDYYLWLGRLRRYKGVWVALEAFRKFAAKHPDGRLVFAGGGPEEAAMRQAVKNWGLESRVEIRGRVSLDEKRQLLRGALALLQSSFKEGWGLTVIEAGVCGTTSLASRVPGLRDSVKDGVTGLLFEAGDVTALAALMARIQQNPAERQKLEAEARRHAKEFSWDKAASLTFEVLQALVSSQPGAK